MNAYPSLRMRPGLYSTVCVSSISTTHLVPSSTSAKNINTLEQLGYTPEHTDSEKKLINRVVSVPDLTILNSNLAGAGAGSGFRKTRFSDHRTIHLMQLMALTMLSLVSS